MPTADAGCAECMNKIFVIHTIQITLNNVECTMQELQSCHSYYFYKTYMRHTSFLSN